MSESSLWKYVKKGMGSRWHAHRHEDNSPDVPDISFGIGECLDVRDVNKGPIKVRGDVQGWIELKAIDERPKKPSTPIRIPHPKRWHRQRKWLKERGRTGASSWLLLRLVRTYYLVHWRDLDLVGEVSEDELREHAYWWEGSISSPVGWGEFTKCLISRRQKLR